MADRSDFVAQSRKRSLTRCLRCRRDIAAGGRVDAAGIFRSPRDIRKILRHDQIILTKLRVLRATGYYPADYWSRHYETR